MASPWEHVSDEVDAADKTLRAPMGALPPTPTPAPPPSTKAFGPQPQEKGDGGGFMGFLRGIGDVVGNILEKQAEVEFRKDDTGKIRHRQSEALGIEAKKRMNQANRLNRRVLV